MKKVSAMSRSRKRLPISGISCAESDKHDKVLAHRRSRRAAMVALACGHEDMPHLYESENPWSYAKDGKRWHGYAHHELMRK